MHKTMSRTMPRTPKRSEAAACVREPRPEALFAAHKGFMRVLSFVTRAWFGPRERVADRRPTIASVCGAPCKNQLAWRGPFPRGRARRRVRPVHIVALGVKSKPKFNPGARRRDSPGASGEGATHRQSQGRGVTARRGRPTWAAPAQRAASSLESRRIRRCRLRRCSGL